MSKATTFPKEKIRVLLLENIHPAALEIFEKGGYLSITKEKKALSEEALLERIGDYHILGIRSKTSISAKVLKEANKLWALSCFCIGTNHVDVKAATDLGIAVFNSPFSNTRSVAELVIGHIIHLLRRVPEKNLAAHSGGWIKDSTNCFEARGKVLGIIGYGHIGSQVSVLAEALGMHVIYYDIEPKLALGNASTAKSMKELLAKADVVTLHVPETPQTKGMIDEKVFKQMKDGAAFINLSRGDVVDLKALKEQLKSGKISGAAIDVFPKEPESNKDKFESPLQGLPNVILTPHIGGSTEEAQANIGIDAASKLLSFLETGSTVGSLSVPQLSLPKQENSYRLLHVHDNKPGVLSEINGVLSAHKVNILGQYLQTNNRIGYVVLDVDKRTSPEILGELKQVKHTIRARSLY